MSRFMNATLSDIRRGRDSWRVVLSLSLPAFIISLVAGLLQVS